MFCRNCGNEIKEKTKFCPYCGTKLGDAEGKHKPEKVGRINLESSNRVHWDRKKMLIGCICILCMAIILVWFNGEKRKEKIYKSTDAWMQEILIEKEDEYATEFVESLCNIFVHLVEKGIISVEVAAEQAHMTEATFTEAMKEAF